VLDQDGAGPARELVARLDGSRAFRRVATLRREADIAAWLDARRALLVLRIGPTFSRDLHARRPAAVQVHVDGRNSNTALAALGYATQIVDRFSRERAGPEAPRIEVRAWFNPNLESRWFVVPGIIGLLTLLVSVLVTAMTVAREREAGTFDQLLVTPLRPVEIILGKTIPGLLVGVAEVSAIAAVAAAAFHIPFRGGPVAFYTGMLLFLLSSTGFGLMISSIAVTQQQGLLGAFLFMMPSVLLSGFATPIANMPPAVQALTLLNPLRYYLVVLRGVFLEGAGAAQLWPQFAAMAAIGLGTLALAGALFRRRVA
jgi:ABC-2 type transport system permease protein